MTRTSGLQDFRTSGLRGGGAKLALLLALLLAAPAAAGTVIIIRAHRPAAAPAGDPPYTVSGATVWTDANGDYYEDGEYNGQTCYKTTAGANPYYIYFYGDPDGWLIGYEKGGGIGAEVFVAWDPEQPAPTDPWPGTPPAGAWTEYLLQDTCTLTLNE